MKRIDEIISFYSSIPIAALFPIQEHENVHFNCDWINVLHIFFLLYVEIIKDIHVHVSLKRRKNIMMFS